MHHFYILFFLSLAVVVAALPAANIPPAQGLRLVKTSEADTGIWVTEEEKFSRFIAKRIPFLDVTETFDLDTIGAAARAGQSRTFPSVLAHQSKANALLPKLSVANVRAGLKTYTGFSPHPRPRKETELMGNAVSTTATTSAPTESKPEIGSLTPLRRPSPQIRGSRCGKLRTPSRRAPSLHASLALALASW
jgi:hypothetical protein